MRRSLQVINPIIPHVFSIKHSLHEQYIYIYIYFLPQNAIDMAESIL